MDEISKQTLIRWQDERERCAWMASFCMLHGDADSAVFWQGQAAYAHQCFLSNQSFIERRAAAGLPA